MKTVHLRCICAALLLLLGSPSIFAEIAVDVPTAERRGTMAATEDTRDAQGSRVKSGPLALAVDLSDGSHLIGEPTIQSVSLQMPYTRIDIPLAKISIITIAGDNRTASFELKNGDRLKGTLDLASIDLTTVFGNVTVRIEHVTAMQVLPCGDAVLPADLKKNLALYYSFDRDAVRGKLTDQSGNGRHGTVHGATAVKNGKVGGAFKFSAKQNDYIEASKSQDMDKSGQLTIATWFNSTSWRQSAYNEMVNKQFRYDPGFPLFLGHVSGHQGWGLCVAASHQSYRGQWQQACSGEKLALNRWYHGVGTWDGKTLSVYLDGELKDSVDVKGVKMPTNDQNVIIGGEKPGWSQWNNTPFDGMLDEVMIWSRALSEKEVKQLYELQNGK